jgi:hypothetical protein
LKQQFYVGSKLTSRPRHIRTEHFCSSVLPASTCKLMITSSLIGNAVLGTSCHRSISAFFYAYKIISRKICGHTIAPTSVSTFLTCGSSYLSAGLIRNFIFHIFRL